MTELANIKYKSLTMKNKTKQLADLKTARLKAKTLHNKKQFMLKILELGKIEQ